MFITGDSLHDHESVAHFICMFIWVLVVIVGILGAIFNYLIFSIVRRQEEKRAFDFLLIVLSAFDLFSSLMAVITVTGVVAFYERWNRGPIALFMIYMPFYLCLLGKIVNYLKLLDIPFNLIYKRNNNINCWQIWFHLHDYFDHRRALFGHSISNGTWQLVYNNEDKTFGCWSNAFGHISKYSKINHQYHHEKRRRGKESFKSS
ncbi:unnamed protein product [Orchesella dallaii]|uniref:Uncharacterized protein n=1 Tax=Orchesella dallaii TaxID=48710 RepID=A0ABP1PLD8_9HEXA